MKSGDLSVIYGILALFSALLCITYLFFDQRRNRLFLVVFGCVLAANSGFFLMSVCDSLALAKIANGLSYFGGAFSILVMLLIVWDVCRMPKCRWLRWLLVGISIAIFSLAASGDWLGLYYRSVSLEKINGMTQLVKEYGPLHILYGLYLLSYMLMMVGIVLYAFKSKRLDSPKYTLFLLVTVLLNLGVWLVEQLMPVDFEFLSVSYIVTAVLLLLNHHGGDPPSDARHAAGLWHCAAQRRAGERTDADPAEHPSDQSRATASQYGGDVLPVCRKSKDPFCSRTTDPELLYCRTRNFGAAGAGLCQHQYGEKAQSQHLSKAGDCLQR